MDPVFLLDDVTKRYGRQLALDHMSLQAEPGTVIALLGENGAGKTTAIRILLGLIEADAGLAKVLGLSSRRQGQQIRRQVGYVPERPTLYEWMTVEEIGWFTAAFYGDGYLPKYNEFITRFELPPGQKLKALSKGMLAKVSLSLAMAHEPDLLILDEPTSGLDPMVRREFLESMVDVAAAGRTVFLSSHQIAEVERVADVVAILKKGQIQVVERLDTLKSDHREVTLTLSNGATGPPGLPGKVVRQVQQDRQCRALIRSVNDEQLEALRSEASVGEIEVRIPSLEEIFVGYMCETDPDERQGP